LSAIWKSILPADIYGSALRHAFAAGSAATRFSFTHGFTYYT